MSARAYYNEHDPYAAEWLRNLISAGRIAPGEVDSRSIEDVRPDDLPRFTQCHFFAGIGVWSHALRLAGWPDDRAVWTGSCPCQPFSAAGAGAGFDDARHLWPVWHTLIDECRPSVLFGEQVEAAIKHGWLDLVQADLERSGYAFGAVGVPAAGVGAPHIRQRLYWVADDGGARLGQRQRFAGISRRQAEDDAREAFVGNSVCATGGVADMHINGREQRCEGRETLGYRQAVEPDCSVVGVGGRKPGPTNGFWRSADWLGCRDGKFRPVEPGSFPLVDGAPSRVGRLRAYGNAIVPEVAKEVILAYLGGAA